MSNVPLVQEGEQLDKTTHIGTMTRTLKVEISWMVRYSPKLTEMFASHPNVEMCTFQLGSTKYHFKYIQKCLYRAAVETIYKSGNRWYSETTHFQVRDTCLLQKLYSVSNVFYRW